MQNGIKFNPALEATLNASPTKLNWANDFKAGLGATRRLRCFRDANAAATDPAATGTEFLNVGLVGEMQTGAGNITSFGIAGNITVRNAADLLTGACVLRIEGNGNWVQGTIGLSVAAQIAAGVATADIKTYDFTLSGPPSINAGYAFLSAARIMAPGFLPTGIGPAAPVKAASSPHRITIDDWTTGAAVQAVDTTLSRREQNWTYEDAEMAASNGDSSVYSTATDSVWKNFLVGAVMTISDKSNSLSGLNHRHAVTVLFAYRDATYTAWPDVTGYDRKNTILNLPPFKAKLWDQNGNLLKTWETQDGKPYNDPSLRSGKNFDNGDSPTQALTPQGNCAQGLFWESDAPRMSDIARKLNPGVEYRESMAKGYAAFNGVEAIITGGNGGAAKNGLAHPYYAQAYPQPRIDQVVTDPYLDASATAFNSGVYLEGYAYQFGAFGLHNFYTPPGGPRPSRAVWPTSFAAFLNDPTGSRLNGNVPWREIADGYRKNYWNLPSIRVQSPSQGVLDPNDELGANWTTFYNYYGDGPLTKKAVILNADQGSGTSGRNYDAQGNMILNGAATDALHAYENMGLSAMIFNDAMAGIGSKFHTVMAFLATGPADANAPGDYMVRVQSWRWLHHVIAWKCASTHPRGISRAKIEARFNTLLDSEYRNTIKPAFVDNDQSTYSRTLRDLGVPLVMDPSSNQYYTAGGFLGYYMGWVLALAKQTGFWSRMKGLNARNALVMDMTIRNYDKFNFDFLLKTNGRPGFAVYTYFGSDASVLPTSWANWQASRTDDNKNGDFVHDSSGNLFKDPDVAFNHFAAYPAMRKRYFPEYANPDLDLAIAKVAAYEKFVDDAVAAAATPTAKRAADWSYRNPSYCRLLAPTVLGPA